MINKKKIEIFGEEPKTLEDKIKDIQDPSLKHHLEVVNSKFRALKNEVDQAQSSTNQFGDFLNRFRKSFSPQRDALKDRSRAFNVMPSQDSSNQKTKKFGYTTGSFNQSNKNEKFNKTEANGSFNVSQFSSGKVKLGPLNKT